MPFAEDRPFADLFERHTAQPQVAVLQELKIHALAIPIHAGRLLHVALTRNAAGVADDIVIGCGYTSEDRLRVLGRGVNVPASALPALRDALEQLDEERTK